MKSADEIMRLAQRLNEATQAHAEMMQRYDRAVEDENLYAAKAHETGRAVAAARDDLVKAVSEP